MCYDEGFRRKFSDALKSDPYNNFAFTNYTVITHPLDKQKISVDKCCIVGLMET